MESIIDKVIDNYKILGVLGRGGMGVVYKATDMTLDRDVALKMMDALIASDQNFLKRFQSEAKALAKLQNPNIVSIFALRETDSGVCIVMEFVKGKTLAEILRQTGALPLPRVMHIFKQCLTALDHAHRAGVIHRDIKPGNIMLTDEDVVKVTDFGLAKIQQPSAATATMATAGTLFYMSPEQIRGLANVDARGDIYSLGMTLYESLTGRLPFKDNESDFAIRQAIVEGKIPPPDKINPQLPKDLVKVVMKSIDKDPAKRFQTGAEMRSALEVLEAGGKYVTMKPSQRSTAFAPTMTSPGWETPVASSNRRILYIALGVVALAVIALVLRAVLFPPETFLSIRTEPSGSKLEINGEYVGETPLTNHKVEPGKLLLRARKEQYITKDTSLSLEEGQSLDVSIPLAKQPVAAVESKTGGTTTTTVVPDIPDVVKSDARARLFLQAVPNGRVTVDDSPVPGGGDHPAEVTVDAGNRSVVFQNPEYGSKTFSVSVRPGETKRLTCYFVGYLSLQSLNETNQSIWGTIVLDGVTTDMQTPRDRISLKAGRHRVSVTRAGYETIEGTKDIVIEPALEQKVYTLVFHLRKQ